MRIYVGSYRVRTSGGAIYVHIPFKLALQLGTRKVKVIMQINSRECNETSFHGDIMIFPATLTPVGDTFRIKIPRKFILLAQRIKDCGFVDVWLEPRFEDWKTKRSETYGAYHGGLRETS